mmetsp:Transcript_32556/g.79918  ORF Transcript_32556/g.79918 Transcript_32556/m.79918 type:complete len:200 (-) Transcript_32556:174-773(-)
MPRAAPAPAPRPAHARASPRAAPPSPSRGLPSLPPLPVQPPPLLLHAFADRPLSPGGAGPGEGQRPATRGSVSPLHHTWLPRELLVMPRSIRPQRPDPLPHGRKALCPLPPQPIQPTSPPSLRGPGSQSVSGGRAAPTPLVLGEGTGDLLRGRLLRRLLPSVAMRAGAAACTSLCRLWRADDGSLCPSLAHSQPRGTLV